MSGAMLWASSGAIWRVIAGNPWRASLGPRRAAMQPASAQSRRAVSNPGRLASPPCCLRQLQRPADDVIFELAVGHVHFAGIDAAAHRDAGGMDGFGIAGHQRVPPVEILALGE